MSSLLDKDKRSLAELSTEELQQRLLDIRNARRAQRGGNKKASSAKKTVTSNVVDVDTMTADDLQKLIDLLGGSI